MVRPSESDSNCTERRFDRGVSIFLVKRTLLLLYRISK